MPFRTRIILHLAWTAILLSLSFTASYAETIKMKSGRIIEGNITEKTEENIKIQTREQTWKIPFNQLSEETKDLIKNLAVVKTDNLDIRQKASSNTIVDKDKAKGSYSDISCRAPSDWLKRETSEDLGAVAFYAPGNKAVIMITNPMPIENVLGVSGTLLAIKTQNKVYAEKNILLFELPCYVYDFDQNFGGNPYKNRGYFVVRKDLIYSITYMAQPEYFDAMLKELETFLNSCSLN